LTSGKFSFVECDCNTGNTGSHRNSRRLECASLCGPILECFAKEHNYFCAKRFDCQTRDASASRSIWIDSGNNSAKATQERRCGVLVQSVTCNPFDILTKSRAHSSVYQGEAECSSSLFGIFLYCCTGFQIAANTNDDCCQVRDSATNKVGWFCSCDDRVTLQRGEARHQEAVGRSEER